MILDLLVTAGIAATVSNYGKSSVNRHQLHDEIAEWRAHKICVDCDVFVRGVSSHVLVHNSENLYVAPNIVLHDGTCSQETTFLTRVEVEFKSVLWCVLGSSKDAERLKESYHSLRKLVINLQATRWTLQKHCRQHPELVLL